MGNRSWSQNVYARRSAKDAGSRHYESIAKRALEGDEEANTELNRQQSIAQSKGQSLTEHWRGK